MDSEIKSERSYNRLKSSIEKLWKVVTNRSKLFLCNFHSIVIQNFWAFSSTNYNKIRMSSKIIRKLYLLFENNKDESNGTIQ